GVLVLLCLICGILAQQPVLFPYTTLFRSAPDYSDVHAWLYLYAELFCAYQWGTALCRQGSPPGQPMISAKILTFRLSGLCHAHLSGNYLKTSSILGSARLHLVATL